MEELLTALHALQGLLVPTPIHRLHPTCVLLVPTLLDFSNTAPPVFGVATVLAPGKYYKLSCSVCLAVATHF